MMYRSRLLSMENSLNVFSCNQYDFSWRLIFRIKLHWTVSIFWVSIFWASYFCQGFQSWEQYSSFGRTRDFHRVSIGVTALVLNVLRIHDDSFRASRTQLLMWLWNLQSLDITTPRSLTCWHSKIVVFLLLL